MIEFLDNAWPPRPDEPVETVTYSDVGELFFNNAAVVRRSAETTGNLWSLVGIDKLDRELRMAARSGEFALVELTLSPAGLAELWRRWQYAIVGAELENHAGSDLSIVVPLEASAELKGAAVMLYILGGPARDYPPAMFAKDQTGRRQKAVSQPTGGIFRPLFPLPKRPRR